MNEARRVLDLLAQGKVSVDEAEKLLRAIGSPSVDAPPRATSVAELPAPKFLRIAVRKANTDSHPEKLLSVRVPIALVKGGMRLGALLPFHGDAIMAGLEQRGVPFDLARLDPAKLDELLRDMGELNVDIDDGKARVRITCE